VPKGEVQVDFLLLSEIVAMTNDPDKARHTLSRWLWIASLALFWYGFVVIAIAWGYATATNRRPRQIDTGSGGDGPWDHKRNLSMLATQEFADLFCGSIFAAISMLIRPRRTTAILFTFCLVSFLISDYSHFWLID
jgi:hypothetical protein